MATAVCARKAARVHFGYDTSTMSFLEGVDLMVGRLGLSWDGEWDDVGGSECIYGGVNPCDVLDRKTSVIV